MKNNKLLKEDSVFGKIYIVTSDSSGAAMESHAIFNKINGPTYTRYFLENNSNFFDIDMSQTSSVISGEGNNFQFVFLDGPEAAKKLHEEKQRISKLIKKASNKTFPGVVESEYDGSKDSVTVFGQEIIDDKTVRQLKNCLTEESLGVLTADAHYGYGQPVGGCVAYKNYISPSGVGFDIACGNYAVKTDIKAVDIDIAKIMDEITRTIGFGVGRPNPAPIDHAVLDKIASANFKPQRTLLHLAKEQLGTIGSGNHFIDIFEDEQGFVWVGVHFGSRGFGHKTASGFMSMAQGLGFTDRVNEGSMEKKPILFDIKSEIGQSYIEAMHLAGEYAYAGRETVVNQVVFDILKGNKTFEVHNHHNFAWLEEHFGENYWVVRKGCTPAMPGQLGFIGANMRDTSVIIEGVDSELSRKGLYSTVHGAGRIMSRTEAAGKKQWVKDAKTGRKMPMRISKGLIDFDEVKKEMLARKVELRGAGADEAPGAYKSLEEVLGYQGDTIKILHHLKPIGVAMAGESENDLDPYKD